MKLALIFLSVIAMAVVTFGPVTKIVARDGRLAVCVGKSTWPDCEARR
jgi:hypothetical protein